MSGVGDELYEKAKEAVDSGLVRLGFSMPHLSDRPEFADRLQGLKTVELKEVDVDRSQLARYFEVVEKDEALATAGHSKYLQDDPRVFNEAVAVHESLKEYEDIGVIDDSQQLSEKIFSQVVNERGLAQGMIDSEIVESNDHYDSVRADQIPGIYMNNIVPEIEGGTGRSFRFTYENGEWMPVTGDAEGIEIIRKPDNPSIGGKSPTSHPEGMYRLRNVEFNNGEPVSSWREDPTEYTSEVRESASTVMNEYCEDFPGLELSLFGSPENGTMKPGSDVEHALHVPIEYVEGFDSVDELEGNYLQAKEELDEFREQVLEDIIDEASVDLSNDAYGYVSVRGEGRDYALGRNQYGGEDDTRLIVNGEGMKFVDYDEHIQQQGLEETGEIQSSGFLT